MLVALFADIHANREAFEACLAHAQAHGAEQHVYLGDLVGYGADPAWVVDYVQRDVAAGAMVVKGNHDAAVTEAPRAGMHADAMAVVAWTRSQLNEAQLQFLGNLPLRTPWHDCLFVHANAYSPAGWDYITGVIEAGRSLMACQERVTFCGHVHEPALYHQSSVGKLAMFKPVPGMAIPLSGQRRWLGIPGSVGQPRDGIPAACYAIYDDVRSMLTFHRVAYDHDAAADKVRRAGLPGTLADRLISGA